MRRLGYHLVITNGSLDLQADITVIAAADKAHSGLAVVDSASSEVMDLVKQRN